MRELRGRTIQALKQRADPAVVDPLLPLLRHLSPLTRAAACEILGTTGDWRATGPLLDCLDDPIPFVLMAAAFALATLGDPAAAATIKARYDAHPADNINVRIALESALDALGIAYTPHPW
jgi:HEAT repeat protein